LPSPIQLDEVPMSPFGAYRGFPDFAIDNEPQSSIAQRNPFDVIFRS
jgi:hypothetical protein